VTVTYTIYKVLCLMSVMIAAIYSGDSDRTDVRITQDSGRTSLALQNRDRGGDGRSEAELDVRARQSTGSPPHLDPNRRTGCPMTANPKVPSPPVSIDTW
jgi:hypothetical protein